MTTAALGTGLVATLVFGTAIAPDLAGGLGGPLLAAVTSWALVERTFRRNPARVGHLMQVAFLAKMVFFVVYVVVMLRVLALRPVPFTVSFTAYFLALYATQAVMLHRLFTPATHVAA
jgi:hypothetical protein